MLVGMEGGREKHGNLRVRAKEPSRTTDAPAEATSEKADAPEHKLLGLQRSVGNRAVSRLVEDGVQRVAIAASVGETLYNQESGSGQATTGGINYTASGSYDITRQDDAGATVLVKIKFMSQTRNTTAPVPPATTPKVGALVGEATEIPGGDPRREWAISTMTAALSNWNGRLTFVGEEQAAEGEGAGSHDESGAPKPKRLPVAFQATPVWGKDDDANATVIVHPSGVVGGSTGNPIDAGNFYQQKDKKVYPADDSVIYAHEYGHLLGIPDEYSQSNQQMHLLLHQASPTTEAAASAALDRVTVERMVLAAMSRPLHSQLDSSMPAIVGAVRAQQPMVTTKMASALRAGIKEPGVSDALRTRLEQSSEESVHKSVPQIAAFETTENFSPRTRATEGVGAEFAGPALTSRIEDSYWTALTAPHGTPVAVDGLGDVRVNMSTGVFAFGQGTGPAAAPAGGLAATKVGAASAPGAPGIPAIPAPAALVGQLTALPATWSAAGSAVEGAITPEAVASRMETTLNAANIAALIAPILPGIAAKPKIAQVGALYRKALELVTNLSTTAAREIVAEILSTTLSPILQSSIAALQSDIHAEVERIMNTPIGPAVAGAATPDADMVAMVAAMKARLDADKAATAASTSRDPVGAGQAAPDQDVTYSYQGLMGSNRTTALRADQFGPMVGKFNANFKRPRERDFKAESR